MRHSISKSDANSFFQIKKDNPNPCKLLSQLLQQASARLLIGNVFDQPYCLGFCSECIAGEIIWTWSLAIMSRSPSWVLIQHRFYSVSFRKIIYKTEKPNLWDAPHFEHSVSLQNNESESYKSDVLSTHLASTSRSGWCRFELESQPPRDTFLTACLHREQISFFSAFSFFAHSVSRRTKFSSS